VSAQAASHAANIHLSEAFKVRAEAHDSKKGTARVADGRLSQSRIQIDLAFNKFTNAEHDTSINFASSKSMLG
jgi:hypothetical protein